MNAKGALQPSLNEPSFSPSTGTEAGPQERGSLMWRVVYKYEDGFHEEHELEASDAVTAIDGAQPRRQLEIVRITVERMPE